MLLGTESLEKDGKLVKHSIKEVASFVFVSCPGHPSLVPRPSARGGEEGLVHTACACALISRHSRNSVARPDFSVLVSSRPYIIQIRIP